MERLTTRLVEERDKECKGDNVEYTVSAYNTEVSQAVGKVPSIILRMVVATISVLTDNAGCTIIGMFNVSYSILEVRCEVWTTN